MIKRRGILLLLVTVLMVQMCGCEAIQRKFTRKKKRKPVSPKFYQGLPEETRPNIELYMMHYVYWKTWHQELVNKAGDNTKRDRMASSEVLGHLNDMKKYLAEEKAEELQGYIDETKVLTDQIVKGGGGLNMKIGRLRQSLDNVRARIVRRFYHKKVRDYIKPN